MNRPNHPWDQADTALMRRALALAARGRGKVEPNPMVGAVIARRGRILGEGYHQRFGGPHAEAHALRKAGPAAKGASLYVTLEPCDHFGKTPPCTDAILAAGIRRVVAAMRDPDSRVSGRGIRKLRRAGLAVEVGLCEAQARALNAPYLKLKTQGIPYVTAKWAMTLDGRIAASSGDSHWITAKPARRHLHKRRGQVDAILVGIGTVLEDDPLLTCRLARGRNPMRIVLDSHARTPLDSRLVRSVSEAEVLIVSSRAAPTRRLRALERAGCQTLVVSGLAGRCSLSELLRHLGERHATHLLVEGGQEVLSAFFRERLVDHVMVYLGSKLIGSGLSPLGDLGLKKMGQALALRNVSIRRIGSDLLVEGLL